MNNLGVLIFSCDPLAGALLGASVELAGLQPFFSMPDESERAALLRVRPRVVLIDCDHEEACRETFVGPALMTGSEVILFRSDRTAIDRTEFASRLKLVVMHMPIEHDALAEILRERSR